MSSENELLPCPCCGGPASWMIPTKDALILSLGVNDESVLHTVVCDECGLTTAFWYSKEKAYEAWNKRHTS